LISLDAWFYESLISFIFQENSYFLTWTCASSIGNSTVFGNVVPSLSLTNKNLLLSKD